MVSRSEATLVLTDTVAASFPEWDANRDFFLKTSVDQTREVPRNLMRDYVRRNARSTRVGSLGSLSVQMFDSGEYRKLFSEGLGVGWATFRRRFPNIGQVLALSRPGFARGGKQALVYTEITRIGGPPVGQLAMLARVGNSWRVIWSATVIAG